MNVINYAGEVLIVESEYDFVEVLYGSKQVQNGYIRTEINKTNYDN